MREEIQCRIEPSFPSQPPLSLALRLPRPMPLREDSMGEDITEATITESMAEATGVVDGGAEAGAGALPVLLQSAPPQSVQPRQLPIITAGPHAGIIPTRPARTRPSLPM